MKNFIPVILIVLAFGSWYFYIDPKYNEIKSLMANKQDYEIVLDEVERIQERRNTLLDKYNNFSNNDLKRLKVFLPGSIDNVRLISDMDGLAGRYGIAIRGITVTENTNTGRGIIDEQNESYGNVDIGFSFETSYENFIRFLDGIESSLRLVDIKSLNLQPNVDTGLYSVSISLRTYWLK